MSTEEVARRMFFRNASTYETESSMLELAWLDPDIRAFWVAEAAAVMADLGVTA